ncbi:hypothetical protein [Streptomyces goshikiensis]|uniref:hypothetical protein n=1 Tax=Streptomyces goshikiensis TaxID=1942 RepID=UPI0036CD3994
MTTHDLGELLNPAPRPTLLPWLARWADPADLPGLARAAAVFADTVDPGWPPIAEAVAETLAGRADASAQLAELADALPPLAGHLSPGAAAALNPSDDRPELLVYRAMAERQPLNATVTATASAAATPSAAEAAADGDSPPRGTGDGAWEQLLALARNAPADVPPLANVRLLAALLTGRAEHDGTLEDGETVYLLPCLDPGTGPRGVRGALALDLVEEALDTEAEWYAAALAARAAPYLDGSGRDRLRDLADGAVEPWQGHLRALATTAHLPWPSVRAELAAAHPGLPALDRAAEATEPAALARLCRQAIEGIGARYGASRGWRASPGEWWPEQPADERGPAEDSEPRPGRGATHTGPVPMSAAGAPAEQPRYVNAHVVDPDHPFEPVSRHQPLLADTWYALRIGIGERAADSLIGHPRAVPEELLPMTLEGHWLEVAAAGDDFEVDKVSVALFLPEQGGAWACPCPPGVQPHRCHPYDRTPYVLLPLRSPSTPGTGRLRVTIHYRGHLLQAFQLSLATGAGHVDGTGTAPAATPSVPALDGWVDYTATEAFTGLDAQAPRTLSVLTEAADDGTCRIYWKAGPGSGLKVAAAEAQLGRAMALFRQKLLSAHIVLDKGGEANAYDGDNSKDRRRYLSDLARLATLGWTLRNSLEAMVGQDLPVADGRPSTIQIARVRNSAYVFPWPVLYDLPLNHPPYGVDDSDWYRPCPVIDHWQRDVIEAGYPHACPYGSAHEVADTLCPYGFWGFRHTIEVPPSARPGLPMRREIPYRDAARMVVGQTLDAHLDLGAVSDHITRIERGLQAQVTARQTSAVGFGNALAAHELQFVYFFCHGLRESQRDPSIGPVVEIGEHDEISAQQIVTWDKTLWKPRREHWRSAAPLVVINGCHTAEISPDALVSFVDAFTRASSAGVIGTEVRLHQNVAAEAAERFFDHFADPGGVDVGEAVRRMRLDLLGKGNVLGLAYTPYCSAELRLLRTPPASAEGGAYGDPYAG